MTAPAWHVAPDVLAAYLSDRLDDPHVASVEAHLLGCEACRSGLTSMSARGRPLALAESWAGIERRLDVSLDSPAPAILARVGVTDELARVLIPSPAVRRKAWMAVPVALASAAIVAVLGEAPRDGWVRILFLVIAPLLPLVATVAALTRAEPVGELAVAAPSSQMRMGAVRAAIALVGSLLLGMAVSVVLDGPWLDAVGWLAPALALSTAGAVLAARYAASGVVGVLSMSWVVGATSAAIATGEREAAFTPPAQLAYLVIAVLLGTAFVARPAELDPRRLP